MRKRRPAQVHVFRRAEGRAGVLALLLFAACDVYNQDLIDSALGDADNRGGGSGGTQSKGGSGGSSSGRGGTVTGGASGTGPTGGGTDSGGRGSGGSETGGNAGDGGEGDTSSGGGSSGRGGNSSGGSGGDSGSAGSAGQGGTDAGSGGAGNAGGGTGGGGAGASGAGAGSGGAGNGGAGNGGGGAGTGGGGEVCSGCARLSVPLAASGDKAHFTIGLPAATDFRTATITFRVARRAGTGGWFKGYIQEGSPNFLYQDSTQTTISSIGTSMQTITWDVATAGTTADKSIIGRIGIEISGAGASSWTNPTIIYVDSITVTGTTLTTSSFTFDTASTVYTTPTSSGPNDVIWLNNYSGDTNVTGAAVSWLGP